MNDSPKNHVESSEMIQTADAAPDRVAAELFAHGLLGALEERASDIPERRIRRVMDAIAPEPIPISRWRLQWRAIATAAAMVAIVGMLFLYGRFPLESTAVAEAVIASALKASRSPGDQRYEIRIVREGDGDVPNVAEATIDTRSPNLLLLTAQTPDGRTVTAGRDAQGEWALRLDGSVDRDRPRGAWPRWATSNEQAIFAEPIDEILEALSKRYTLSKGASDPEVPSLEHIIGVKKHGGGPSADQIDVFIDRSTNLVERLEMRWSPETHQEMKRRWQERLRKDGPPRSLAGPEEVRVDRPGTPPPMLAERSGRGDGRGPGRGNGLGPARDMHADGRPPHAEPPTARGDCQLRPRLGFGGGPPLGKRFGPPRLFVIERVETPEFTDRWFSPDEHLTENASDSENAP